MYFSEAIHYDIHDPEKSGPFVNKPAHKGGFFRSAGYVFSPYTLCLFIHIQAAVTTTYRSVDLCGLFSRKNRFCATIEIGKKCIMKTDEQKGKQEATAFYK